MFAGTIANRAVSSHRISVSAQELRAFRKVEFSKQSQVPGLFFLTLDQCYFCDEGSGLHLLFLGFLSNAKTLSETLGISSQNSASILLAAWQEWGVELATHLEGEFSVIIHDSILRETHLFTDAFSTRPIFYFEGENFVDFATSPKPLITAHRLAKNTEWMQRFVLENWPCDREIMPYLGLRKLMPNSYLLIKNGRIVRDQVYHHWQAPSHYEKKRHASFPIAYRRSVEDAMAASLKEGPIICETSAGIDSSVLLTLLARFVEKPNTRVHILYGEEGSDSTKLVDALAQKLGGFKQSSMEAFDLRKQIQEQIQIFGYPAYHVSYTSGDILKAYKDVGIVFSGFGGDEAATENGSLFLREAVANRDWKNLWQSFYGHPIKRIYRVPLFILRTLFGKAIRTTEPAQHDAMKIKFCKTSQSDKDALTAQGFTPADQFKTQNALITQKKLTSPNMHQRTESHGLYANAFGFEFRWPLLNKGVISQVLNTPSIERWGPGGMSRYLHRRAFDGDVPDAILWRPSKRLGSDIDIEFSLDKYEAYLADIEAALQSTDADMHKAFDFTKAKEILDSFKKAARSAESYDALYDTFEEFLIMNEWCELT